MNFGFYIIGRHNNCWDQYPNDFTAEQFSKFCSDVKGSRLTCYIDGGVIYYVYIQRIDSDNFIGLALAFRDAAIYSPVTLYNILHQIVTSDMPHNGSIIKYDDQGNLQYTETSLSDNTKAYFDLHKHVENTLVAKNSILNIQNVVIPNITNSGQISTVGIYTKDEDIIHAVLNKFNSVAIDSDEAFTSDYTYNIIEKLKTDINEATHAITQQQETITKLQHARTQYRKVLLLCGVLIVSCIGIYFLYTNLNRTELQLKDTSDSLAITNSILDDARHTISQQKLTITENTNIISELNLNLKRTTEEKEHLDSILTEIKNNTPFIITNTTVNWDDDYYTVYYNAPESGYQKLNIKVLLDNGNLYTSKTIEQYIDKGSGSFNIYFSRNLHSENYYTFEVWLDNYKILGGSRH